MMLHNFDFRIGTVIDI